MAVQRWSSYGWILALLLVFGGVAWLTRNPDSPILERAREWPLIGDLADTFRRAYQPQPSDSGASEPVPVPETDVEVITAPPVRATGPRFVWVQPGASLHAEPDLESPVLATVEAIRNLSVISQRGDWYWVWLPRGEGRPLRAWVWLEDYRPPTREVLQQADPVLPLPASSPDPDRLVVARRLMRDGGVELGCGDQALITDVPEDEVASVCSTLTGSLETLYRERYGLRPVGPPAEAILLFGRAKAYRAFRALEGVAFDHGLAHASPAQGYLALFRGSMPTEEVLSTLVHEATHLLNRRALGPALPHWLNEGLADDLAQSRIDAAGHVDTAGLGGEEVEREGQIVVTGGRAAAAALLDAMEVGDLPSLRQLQQMDDAQFHRADRVELNYAASSFWVRYLVGGADPGLTRGFRRFLQDVATGQVLDDELLLSRLGTGWEELEAGFRLWLPLQYIPPTGSRQEVSG
jgi:hypothetical protein